MASLERPAFVNGHPNRAARLVWRLISLVPVLFALPGCVIAGRDYVRPEVPAPAAWNTEAGGGVTAGQTDPEMLATWWTTLGDATLASLIERALAKNLDVREARARVREARARRGVAQAGLFPTVDSSMSFRHSRTSEETGGGTSRELSSAGFDASWELDLFGGVRRAVEAAEAELQASEEDLRDVLVSLLAEVALNYVDVRSFQTRLSVAEANLGVQTETYDITRWRREAGLTTQLDVEQARSNLEDTRARIPSLRTGVAQSGNRIAVLLGEAPGVVHADLDEHGPIPVAPLAVAVGVPADVLRRRPDVRRAERALAAQTAQVGVATAELYPKFSLLGSIGLESLSASDLFSAGSRTYSIGPSVTWRVFDAGAIRSNIEIQSALQEQTLIQYEAAVLGALEEVENALVAYAEEQLRREALVEATHAAQQAVDLSGDQYVSGLIDFQVVLDAQRTLLSLQDQRASSEAAIASDLIRLYKALGGGWTSLEPLASATDAAGESSIP